MTLEISEVRRRLVQRINRTRKAAAARRTMMESAQQDYERFLADVANPVFLMFASALRAEGHPFKATTPAGSVRLVSDKSGEDFIELVLDTASSEPALLGRSSRSRGRRRLTAERPLREHARLSEVTEEDVLEFLLTEIEPFVER